MTPHHRGGKTHLASILLLYAYARDLVHLKEEEREVCAQLDERTLYSLGIQRYTDPHIEDGNRLIKAVKARKDDLLLLSYSGHANEQFLKLEHTPARAEGFAGIVEECKNLKCILLNGCNTYEQVEFFHSAGIPIVIATHTSVKDKDAKTFAVEFFKALRNGKTLRSAYQSAKIELSVFKDTREYKVQPIERSRGFGHKPNGYFYGLSYLKEKEGLLDLSLHGFLEELSIIQAFKGKPRYQNILFIGDPHPESYPDISKSLEIIFRKQKYNCAFFNPDFYLSHQQFGCRKLKENLLKAGKVVFLIDQGKESLKFYNDDFFFDSCIEIVKQSGVPVEVSLMNLWEYEEATSKLVEKIPNIRKFPEYKDYYYYSAGRNIDINYIKQNLGNWLRQEEDAIRKHLDKIDLELQRNLIHKFFTNKNQHSKANLLVIPADERSEWELLIKFAKSYIPNHLPIRPFSYSSKFIDVPNSLQELCKRFIWEFQFDESGGGSIEQAFFQNLKLQLDNSPVFWVIRDIDLEDKSLETICTFWKALNQFFSVESFGHSLYMVWSCRTGEKTAGPDWGEIENLPGNICRVAPISLLDDTTLASWIRAFYEQTKIHIDGQDFNVPISLREAVRIACRQLNQDSWELEVFRF